MIKKINIVGMELDNYTAREMLNKTDRIMSENGFVTVEEVSMATLKAAGQDENVKEALQSIDYTVIADNGILDAASENSAQRKHEVEEHVFLYEVFKRLERNRKTVFILGENEEGGEATRGFLEQEFPKLKFVGVNASSDAVEAGDKIVNEINIVSPNMVLSVLPTPTQELFIKNCKDKISANFWYGIGNNKLVGKKPGIIRTLKKKLDVRTLSKRIINYEKEEM